MTLKWPFILLALAAPAFAGEQSSKNVLGQPLTACGIAPLTGAYRDGNCRTGPDDPGVHAVCATMTAEFLEFTRQKGNDLVTAAPQSRFPGLKPGDKWCLCAARWTEAKDAGVAPPVDASATDEKALGYAPLDAYQRISPNR